MGSLQLFFMICIVPFIIAFIWYLIDWKIEESLNKNSATVYKIATFAVFVLLSKYYIEAVIKVMF